MSNSLAVATVTSAIRLLLDTAASDVPGLSVTTKHPDRARIGETGNQLNVFLYHLSPNAAWRNAELPEDRTGASGFLPPVALTLEYLVTAFAAEDDDIQAQRLLGRAVSILHDAAVLDRSLLQNALAGSDVHLQPDRVRITATPLSLEDVSKLWTSFVSNFRLSVAYTAAPVLIESTGQRPSPLPVLRRGDDGRGVLSRVGVGPSLDRASPAVGQPGVVVNARLGDRVVLEGVGLAAEHRIRFRHPLVDDVELTPLPGATATRLTVQLPSQDEPGASPAEPGARRRWVAGVYTVAAVETQPDGRKIPSNEVPLAISPIIGVSPTDHSAGDVHLTVTCSPQVRGEQTATLLFGSRQVDAESTTTNAGTDDPSELDFTVPDVASGTYVVRLRVGGCDSLPVAVPEEGEPLPTTLDEAQQVKVT